jgi:hypothetical protein
MPIADAGASKRASVMSVNHTALMVIARSIIGHGKCLCVRYPKLGPWIGIGEPAGQYSDHRVRIRIEADRFAQEWRRLLQGVSRRAPREQPNVIAFWLVLLGCKSAPESWVYSQH